MLNFFNNYAFDPRSLGLFRIGLGLLIITDILSFFPHINLLFSDHGILPPDAYSYKYWYNGSFLKLTGSYEVLACMLIFQGLVACLLVIGWQVRITLPLSFVLLLSLNHRFPAALNSGDDLLGLMLFWGLFLSLIQVFTLKGKKGSTHGNLDGVSSFAYSVQIALVYLMTVLLKNNQYWLYDGSAVFYALNLPDVVRPFWMGKFSEMSWLYQVLSPITMLVEFLLGACILVLPFLSQRLRMTIICTGILMHGSFYIFLDVGIFPLVSMVAYLPFIPSAFWENKFIHVSYPRSISSSGPLKAFEIFKLTTISLFLYVVISWNIKGYFQHAPLPLWKASKYIGEVLDLRQKWGMFSTPATSIRWLSVKASDTNDNSIELLTPGMYLDDEPPKPGQKMYQSHRVQLLMDNLGKENYDHHRRLFLKWICEQGKRDKGPSISKLYLFSYRRKNFPMGYEKAPIQIDTLYSLSCPDNDLASANHE